MAAEASAAQTQDPSSGASTLQTVLPSGGLSPYLLMQAQKEQEELETKGTPPPEGGALEQVGRHVQATGQIPPHIQAMHGERAGVLSPGTTQKVMAATLGVNSGPQAAQTPANPAGAAGSDVGDISQGQSPSSNQTPLPKSPQQLEDSLSGLTDQQKAKYKLSQIADALSKQGTTTMQKTGATPGVFSTSKGEVLGLPRTMEYGPPDVNGQPGPLVATQEQPNPENDPQVLFAKNLANHLANIKAQQQQPTAQRPMDLSGLMMAADYLNHTNTFGKDYARQRAGQLEDIKNNQGQDQENIANEAAALKEQGNNAEDVNKTALGVMGGGAAGSANQMVNSIKTMNAINTGTDKSAGDFKDWSNAVLKDPILMRAIESSNELGSSAQLVNQNQNISALLAKGQLLHAAFKRVNQTEYTAAGGDPGTANTLDRLEAKYNDFIGKNPGQDPSKAFTPEDLKEFKQAIGTLSSVDSKAIEDRKGTYKVYATGKGLSESQTQPVLDSIHGYVPPKAPDTTNQPTKNTNTKLFPPTGPHGAFVTQGGVRFNWNRKTGKYQ